MHTGIELCPPAGKVQPSFIFSFPFLFITFSYRNSPQFCITYFYYFVFFFFVVLFPTPKRLKFISLLFFWGPCSSSHVTYLKRFVAVQLLKVLKVGLASFLTFASNRRPIPVLRARLLGSISPCATQTSRNSFPSCPKEGLVTPGLAHGTTLLRGGN